MRSFETRGPVYPEDNYVVARTDELSDFINRLEKGRYVVLFAPRQTGKTTFFHRALDTLPADVYFPIQIDFQASNNLEPCRVLPRPIRRYSRGDRGSFPKARHLIFCGFNGISGQHGNNQSPLHEEVLWTTLKLSGASS